MWKQRQGGEEKQPKLPLCCLLTAPQTPQVCHGKGSNRASNGSVDDDCSSEFEIAITEIGF